MYLPNLKFGASSVPETIAIAVLGIDVKNVEINIKKTLKKREKRDKNKKTFVNVE